MIIKLQICKCTFAVAVTNAWHHSTKAELRFYAGSNPVCAVTEVCEGENLLQWYQLEMRLNAFHRPTIPQNYITNTVSHSLTIQSPTSPYRLSIRLLK